MMNADAYTLDDSTNRFELFAGTPTLDTDQSHRQFGDGLKSHLFTEAYF